MQTPPETTAVDLLAGRLTLRIEETATLLGMPSRTVRDHVRRNDIRGIRLGKGRRAIVLIPVEEIRRILSGGK